MSQQPDFIITVGGQDMTEYCVSWELCDDEERMSCLSCTLGNPDFRLTGVAKKGDPLAIRFGYEGELSGKAEFPIKELRRSYPTGDEPTIELKGHDEQEKLQGGKCRGNFKEDMTPREIMEDIAKAYGLELKGEGDGPKINGPFSVYNEKPRDVLYRLQKMIKGKKGKGKPPKSSMEASGKKPGEFQGDKWDAGDLLSGVGPDWFKSEDGKKVDKNRAANNANAAAGDQITAELELKGYPTLKAKKCVSIVAYGEDSGTYYVKKVTHKWDLGSGFRSTADLVRGGTGSGGAGGEPPTVMYTNIYSGKELYVGPRQLDGEVQATFTYGDGTHVIRFVVNDKEQESRGGGEQGSGDLSGYDPWKRGEPYNAEASGEEGE